MKLSQRDPLDTLQQIIELQQNYLLHQDASSTLEELLNILCQQTESTYAFLCTSTPCNKSDNFVCTAPHQPDASIPQEELKERASFYFERTSSLDQAAFPQLFGHSTDTGHYVVCPLSTEGCLIGFAGLAFPKHTSPPLPTLAESPLWKAILAVFIDFKKRLHTASEARDAAQKILRNEEELRAAQKITRVGTWRYKTSSQELSFSEEAYRIWQRDPEQGPPSLKEFADSTSPEDRERFYSALQRCIDKHQPFELHQHHRLDNDKEIHLVLQGTAQLDQDGRCSAVFGTLQDVTERTQALEEKQRLEERLYQSQRLESLGLLAGGIAHDINNLLVGVFTEASLLKRNVDLKSSVSLGLERIMDASYQIRQLARQLLAYSGHGRLSIESFSPDQMVQELRTFLQRNIPSSTKLILNLRAPHAAILADLSQLQQVLMNLVLNASEAIAHTQGTIHLQSRVVGIPSLPAPSYPAPHGWWELCIEDNGSGIPPEAKKRLLEPFFTTKKQGRGLGLAIVAGIVHRLNGTIHHQDALPQGTRFFIRLPIHPSDVLVPIVPQSPPPPSQVLSLSSRHILLADDEELVRKLLERLLAHEGCRTTSTNDGLEAIEIFRKSPNSFDLVLLDVSMPQCNGYDAIQQMRQIRSDIPIILISGFSEGVFGGTWKDELQSQPNAFLEKPFKAQELISLLHKHLPQQTPPKALN
ncbi:MAG: response regulator [Myxococcales bacterium]|nr:response regulator [Myxococcales bacterium]